jgi:hypothetical protein
MQLGRCARSNRDLTGLVFFELVDQLRRLPLDERDTNVRVEHPHQNDSHPSSFVGWPRWAMKSLLNCFKLSTRESHDFFFGSNTTA